MYRKKMVITLISATVLFSAGTASVSLAAAGWQQKSGDWVYLDKDGNYLRDVWKKTGQHHYYLDNEGKMAVSALVEYNDDIYYVDEDGKMVTNQWVSFPNNPGSEALCDEPVTIVWYYFGPSGKACADTKKTIDGKVYLFDEDGHMLSGWQTYGDNSDWYYLGTENEGFAHTGWQYLEPDEEMNDEGDGDYDSQEWFYVRTSNGKAYRETKKQINGRYYTFDANGVMKDKWAFGTPSAPDYSGTGITSAAVAFYNEDEGDLQSKWVYTYAPDDPDESGDEDWYYLDSKGVPFNYQAKDSFQKIDYGFDMSIKMDGTQTESIQYGVAARIINHKTYLFDENGKMMTGFYYLQGVKVKGSSKHLGFVQLTDNTFTGGFYYFNEKEGSTLGQMMTGKRKVEEESDDYHYYFRNNGLAYTNTIVGGSLYGSVGIRVSAGDGYELYQIPDDIIIYEKGSSNQYKDCAFIVNESGKLKKSGTVKIDGVRYTVEHYRVVKEEDVE